MQKDANGFYLVKLHHVGISPRSGTDYPEQVLAKAIAKLKERQNPILMGESSNPSQGAMEAELRASKHIPEALIRWEAQQRMPERCMSIRIDRVSHYIDVASLEIVDGLVVGKAKPHGPAGEALWPKVLTGEYGFALRGLVEYTRGNTTDPNAKHNVNFLQLITFDLCPNKQ